MRFYLLFIISVCTTLASYAQGGIRLTVEWNAQSSRYEVFALSQTNRSNLAIGNAQVSLVLPSSAPDAKLVVTSHAGGNWADQKIISGPSSSAGNDFHGVVSTGGVVNLVANQGLLLFSFKFFDSVCRDGIRLYNNGVDPNSKATGFNGIDFQNSITGSTGQMYSSNVSNSGTKCSECPVQFSLPVLKKVIK